jgi:hypothetical protein
LPFCLSVNLMIHRKFYPHPDDLQFELAYSKHIYEWL